MIKKTKAVGSCKDKQKKGSSPKEETAWMTGGETHQTADGKHPALTTNQGVAVDQGGRALLKKANAGQDAGVMATNDRDGFVAASKTRQWDREKFVRTLA